jgi:hypothetical protein
MLAKIEKHRGVLNLILTALLVVANIALWNTTKNAVREARQASQGTLLVQLNRDVFRDQRMYGIRKAIESKKPILEAHKGKFSEQELEDFIGYLDMIQGFVDKKILDCDLVEDNFAGYADEAYSNKEIREYLADLRREMNDEKQYDGFEKLAKAKGVCKG